jgi:hypothetical protein
LAASFKAFLLHCSCTYVTRTPALGRRFLVKSQMPNIPWALEGVFFSSAVMLVITVLGGKEGVHSTYDRQISPISSQRTGI